MLETGEFITQSVAVREHHLSARRAFPFYTSIIRNIARLRQYNRQRYTDGDGEYVFIEAADIDLANALIDGVLSHRNDNLTGTLKVFYDELLHFIKTSAEAEITRFEFSTRTVRQVLKYGETQTRHYLQRLHELEYIRKVRSKTGGFNYYSICDGA